MTIKEAIFNSGLLVPQKEQSKILTYTLRHLLSAKIVVPEVGTHDITPKVWKKSSLYRLEVSDSGSGVLTVTPRSKDVSLLEQSNGNRVTDNGVKRYDINENSEIAIIAGPTNKNPLLQVHRLVWFEPNGTSESMYELLREIIKHRVNLIHSN